MINILMARKLKLNSNSGFTLIELVVVVAILSVAMSLGGYGVSQVFDSKVESAAEDIYIELHNIQYNSMTDIDTTYALVFTYNAVASKYGYKIYKKDLSNTTVSKTVEYSSHLSIEININGSWVDISTLNPLSNEEDFTISFSSLDGGCLLTDFSGNTIGTFSEISGSDQSAAFRIKSTKSNQERELKVIQLTGRVSIKSI